MDHRSLLESLNPWWHEPAARLSRSRHYHRHLHTMLLARLQKPDRRALVVAGPRQVGKTTLLHQLIDSLLDTGLAPLSVAYFDFADERILEPLISARDVEEALPALPLQGSTRYLFLDEIRRSQNWDRWLKSVVDRRDTSLRIVATDSAASLLHKAARESGQGRWDEFLLEGLDLREFVELSMPGRSAEEALELRPDLLESYLFRGGFPEHVLGDSVREAHDRIRADIADRAIVRDLSRLKLDVERARRLFVYLTARSGDAFDPAARARDLEADKRSIESWVPALLDTGLLRALPQRSGSKSSSRLSGRQKLYAADHGLVAAFGGLRTPGEERLARIFEAVVFRHLRGAVNPTVAGLSFYRRSDKAEIDFVLDTQSGPLALEVTSSIQPMKHLSRLQAAADEIGARKIFLIQGGWAELPASKRGSSIRSMPLARFLLRTREILEEVSDG